MDSHLFLSVIFVCDEFHNKPMITSLVRNLQSLDAMRSIEMEFILVATSTEIIDDFWCELDSPLLPNQRVLLGERVSFDGAALAGCTLANGDWALIVGPEGGLTGQSIPRLLAAATSNKDFLVGVESRPTWTRIRENLLIWVLSTATGLSLQAGSLNSVMISRRGLNWALKFRPSARYIPEIYLSSPLRTEYVSLDQPQIRVSRIFRIGSLWPLLSRETQFPIQVLKGILTLVTGILCLFVLNAGSVVIQGKNLINQPEAQVPGWATVVIVLAIGFIAIIYALLILVRTHVALGRDLRADPVATIQAVTRD